MILLLLVAVLLGRGLWKTACRMYIGIRPGGGHRLSPSLAARRAAWPYQLLVVAMW